MEASILLWLLAVVLTVLGLAGFVLPGLPGPPLLLAGLVAGAWAEDFAHVGAGTLALLAFLAVLAYAVDFIASALGARHFGASKRAAVGAVVGLLVGVFFGLPGIILGPFVGALLGELSMRRDIQAAGRAGLGATLGLVLGTAVKFAIAASMLGAFALARFF